MLTIDAVSIKRGGRTVISGLSMQVAAGEIVGVVGKNGCGKSTLLMAIAGVLAPADGRITIGGASVWGTARDRRKARMQLGYVPEGADAPGFLRAGELWELCAAARGTDGPSPSLIERLGLDELRDLALDRMSLGQRRRACLAAGLLGPPALLVLDEPENGLDARRIEALIALLRDQASAGKACVLATHDTPLLEAVGARIHQLTG